MYVGLNDYIPMRERREEMVVSIDVKVIREDETEYNVSLCNNTDTL